MTSETAPHTVSSTGTDLVLPKATFDLLYHRRQMFLGLVAILVLCFVTGWHCLSVSLDNSDWNSIETGANTLSQVAHSFDPFASDHQIPYHYGPLFHTLLFAEFNTFVTNPIPYHLVNILLRFASCTFLALLVFELTGRFGNRLGACPAIWAGLLYAACPIHVGSEGVRLTQILLCSAFELGTIFCLLRFQLLRERPYYFWSVSMAAMAFMSDVLAVSLPCLVTATLMLTPPPVTGQPGKNSLAHSILPLLPFWLILIVYALLRANALQPIFLSPGGFLNLLAGPGGITDPLVCLKWCTGELLGFDKPNNLSLAAIAAVILPASRVILRTVSWPTILCLFVCLLWSWLPFPFFCACIVLCALPAIDRSDKNTTVILSAAGSLVLLILLVWWTQASTINQSFSSPIQLRNATDPV